MKRGVLFLFAFLLTLSLATAVDIPDDFSLEDLPPEVLEKLPADFSIDDLPEDFSQEDALALADEYNISIAEFLDLDSPDAILNLCNELLSSFNFDDVNIPSYVPFSYDVFNIFLANQSVAHIELADKKIVSVNCSGHPQATYEIFIKDIDTLTKVTSADYILDAYRHEKKQGNIKIKGIRFGQMLKVGFLHAAIGVMSIFG